MLLDIKFLLQFRTPKTPRSFFFPKLNYLDSSYLEFYFETMPNNGWNPLSNVCGPAVACSCMAATRRFGRAAIHTEQTLGRSQWRVPWNSCRSLVPTTHYGVSHVMLFGRMVTSIAARWYVLVDVATQGLYRFGSSECVKPYVLCSV